MIYGGQKMFDILGKEVYFIDQKARKVNTGIVLSATISQSGYDIAIILSEGLKRSIETALVFWYKEEADEALPKVLAIKDEMDAIEKEANDKLDEKRKLVIGEPQHKELADDLFGRKN